jgi:hypothetical protein
MTPLLANAPFWGLNIGELAILIIVIAGIVGIVFLVLREMGIAIPAFVIRIFWIVVCIFLAVLAIRFLMTM